MTQDEEDEVRKRLSDKFKLNKEQIDWYVSTVKEARAELAEQRKLRDEYLDQQLNR
jgi:hypothetical protein